MRSPQIAQVGRIAYEARRDRYFIDCRPHGRIWSLGGVAFSGNDGKTLAQGVLKAIEIAVASGSPLEDAIAP